ncbi:MAG: hypothetical protein K2J68_09805 [Treponemataceae bacterium]|nr:hypothetical protein [Treponemataceae bacterium]
MSIKNTDIFGRKVFFVAPDSSLVPMSFMEDFCTLGYESHILSRGDGSLTENIDIVISHFPDALLYVNIDANVSGIGWLQFVRKIRQQNPDVLVGVIFSAPHQERIHHVENEFGNDVSPLAGCVALAPGAGEENFKTLVTALEKAGAKGRRNSIRALCNDSSYISFGVGGKAFHARVDDVNISHISCVLGESGVHGMRIYDKVRAAHICVNGLEFSSDVVLIMKREKGGLSTAVFMFIKKPDDEPGLEKDLELELNKKIYEITSREFTKLLKK